FDKYVAHLMGVLPNRLDGLKIVLDEAHGAAARVSPEAFAGAGGVVGEWSPDSGAGRRTWAQGLGSGLG
ncbi:hypothetical protein OTB20_07795, partial [Streptomyces sp. H27-H1]|nr:hypothetical protein [Streptomyces sp. H27-H1]